MVWKILFVYLSVIAISNKGSSQGLKFVTPIGGTYLKDYFIAHYVDRSVINKNAKDFNNGNKTFKFHEGTDFAILSFRQLDSLVPVFAAADGIIYSTWDSLPDKSVHGINKRNKLWNDSVLGNQIIIQHNDTLYTLYGNLKRNSIKVKSGDTVKSGQIIAYVGCSGFVTYPQLHFEVRNKYNKIDPFNADTSQSKCLWKNQLSYDTITRIFESGFVNYVPRKMDSLVKRICAKTDFDPNDSIINHWILISGLHKNDILRTDWYTDEQVLWHSYKTVIKYDIWDDYFWSWISNPVKRGKISNGWICVVSVNNKLIKKDYFNLINKKRPKR